MPSTGTITALAAFGNALAPIGDEVDDLRLLLALQESTRIVATRLAAITSTPVRAAAFLHTAERAHRDAGHLQFQAAAAAGRCHVEHLTATELDAIAILFEDPGAFVDGGAQLPEEPSAAPAGRPTYADAGEFLAEQLNLTSFAAANRLEAAGNLIAPPAPAPSGADPDPDPDPADDAADTDATNDDDDEGNAAVPLRGAVPSGTPARYPLLAGLLAEGRADPREVAAAARKLEQLRADIERQPDPTGTLADFEARIAGSLAGTHSGATNKLLRTLEAELAAKPVEPDEAAKRARCGLTYQGMKFGLHYYQLVCDGLDAEYLRSYFDALDNPLSNAGSARRRTRTASIGSSRADGLQPEPGANPDADFDAGVDDDTTGACAAEPGPAPAPIPDWAIDPETPIELRPVSDFADDAPESAADWWQPAPPRPVRHLAALLEAMRRSGNPGADPGTGPVLPAVEIVLHIDSDALRGHTDSAGTTAHGTLLSAETVRRLACNSNILPIQFGGDGAVLDIGRRKRRFPGHMVRAIAARDGGCCYPGCTMPAARTEIHHVRSWLEGGSTSVANGCCLCVGHHHALHAGRFTMVVLGAVPHVLLPRDLDPPQLPRRNTYWHPGWRAA